MNTRRLVVITVEAITWSLFAVATFLLARQTWYAVQGLQPDYSGQQAAIIVAGIVTVTWLVMLARIVLQIDRTPVDWLISLSLLLLGIAVDVAVALSVIFDWTFPVHIALIVIVAHVLAHVVQWIIAAGQAASERFSGAYQSPEDKLAAAQQETARLQAALASSEQARSMLEQTQSKLAAEIEQLKQAAEQRLRGFEWTCPDCGAEFKHASEESLRRAKTTHRNQRCPKRAGASSNGHHPERVRP